MNPQTSKQPSFANSIGEQDSVKHALGLLVDSATKLDSHVEELEAQLSEVLRESAELVEKASSPQPPHPVQLINYINNIITRINNTNNQLNQILNRLAL